jgi:hypothetical protein
MAARTAEKLARVALEMELGRMSAIKQPDPCRDRGSHSEPFWLLFLFRDGMM